MAVRGMICKPLIYPEGMSSCGLLLHFRTPALGLTGFFLLLVLSPAPFHPKADLSARGCTQSAPWSLSHSSLAINFSVAEHFDGLSQAVLLGFQFGENFVDFQHGQILNDLRHKEFRRNHTQLLFRKRGSGHGKMQLFQRTCTASGCLQVNWVI